MTRINIIGESNGVGLTRDINLLVGILIEAGLDARAVVLDARQGRRRRSRWMQRLSKLRLLFYTKKIFSKKEMAEINIMLEHIWHEHLVGASVNIVIPNPEWFDRHDLRFLNKIDGIWAKTENTKKIFSDLGCKIYGAGFISEDRWMPCEEKEKSFLHVAGKSVMKGTRELLQCWVAHPEWPKLTVVQNIGADREFKANNIEYITGYLLDQELKILQNKYWFHVCPSQTEGWGHYIVEALSCGAVVITLDAPPMNEMINKEHGVLVDSKFQKRQKLADCFSFEMSALKSAVNFALGLDELVLKRKSSLARLSFLEKKNNFIVDWVKRCRKSGSGLSKSD